MLRTGLCPIAVVGLSLAWAACGPSNLTVVASSLPDEVDYAAVIQMDSAQNIVASSGLSPRVDGQFMLEVDSVGGAANLLVATYDEAVLLDLSPPTDDTLASSPVVVVEPEAANLPPATWAGAGEIDGDRVDLVQVEAPPLRSSWVGCAQLGEGFDSVAVDVQCGDRTCEANVMQAGCSVFIDTQSCVLGTIEGQIEGGNLVEIQDNSYVSDCHRVDPASEALASISCARRVSGNDCQIDLYGLPHEPRFEIETASILPITPPSDVLRDDQSFIWDLAVIDQTLIVAGHPDNARTSHCVDPTDSSLFFVDTESLSLVSTATAPPCLTRIAVDRAESELIGLFSARGQTIGRFSKDGRLLASEPIVAPQITQDMQATRLLIDEHQGRVYAAFRSILGQNAHMGHVLVFDLQTLALLDVSRSIPDDVEDLQPGPEGRIVALGTHEDTITFLTAEALDVVGAVGLDVACGVQGLRTRRILAPSPSRLIVSASDPFAEIHVLDLVSLQVEHCLNSATFERGGEPTEIALFGTDRAIVALYDETSQSSGLAALDLRTGRFLTGSVSLSDGPVSALTVSGAEAFAALGWTGTIVRIVEGRR